tara:strand:- start:1058 stop:1570 length:513 start_codon:yes stop_codon:yes gene_type:complete
MFGFEDFYKEIPLCEFCGVGLDVGERHLNECPVNYIEPDNMQSVLAAQYDLSQYIDEPDTLAFNLGLQLMMASDAIIQAQKQWAAKSLMDKFSEVLNRYTDLTKFIESLTQAGVFLTAEDVIEFLNDPAEFDELFAVWLEHGQPSQNNDLGSWQIFLGAIKSQGWNTEKN